MRIPDWRLWLFVLGLLLWLLAFSSQLYPIGPSQEESLPTTPQWMLDSNVSEWSSNELKNASLSISMTLMREVAFWKQRSDEWQASSLTFEQSLQALERRTLRLQQSEQRLLQEVNALRSSLDETTRSYESYGDASIRVALSLRKELETARNERDREAEKARRWRVAGSIGIGAAATAVLVAIITGG